MPHRSGRRPALQDEFAPPIFIAAARHAGVVGAILLKAGQHSVRQCLGLRSGDREDETEGKQPDQGLSRSMTVSVPSRNGR